MTSGLKRCIYTNNKLKSEKVFIKSQKVIIKKKQNQI